MSQLEGLIQGYGDNHASEEVNYSKILHLVDVFEIKQLSYMDFVLMNSAGDLDDLIPALVARRDWDQMNIHEMLFEMRRRSHCSVLFKVTGDLSGLYAGTYPKLRSC